MENKDKIEIPFGAKDSELYECEYTIPEGYEAEIKDGKVIIRKKESEDEKIRNTIFDCLYKCCDSGVITREQRCICIAWLEKQGEHAYFLNNIQIGDKVTRNEDGVLVNLSQLNRVAKKDEKQGEQKPVVIPKFRIGDIIKEKRDKYGDSTIKIEAIDTENYYYFDKDFPIKISEQNDWELVEQTSTNKAEPKFKVGQTIKKEDFNPGFTIIKIEDGFYYNDMGDHFPFTDQDNWELVEQKPAEWSEEDEKQRRQIERIVSNDGSTKKLQKQIHNWFESLKDRVIPQPKQEWSEEDKKLIDDTCHLINTLASGYGEKVTEPITFSGSQMIASIKDRLRALVDNRPKPKQEWSKEDREMRMKVLKYLSNRCNVFEYEEVENWLKSLRPQSQWRPSEEQIRVVARLRHCLLEDVRGNDVVILDNLLEQLKAL